MKQLNRDACTIWLTANLSMMDYIIWLIVTAYLCTVYRLDADLSIWYIIQLTGLRPQSADILTLSTLLNYPHFFRFRAYKGPVHINIWLFNFCRNKSWNPVHQVPIRDQPQCLLPETRLSSPCLQKLHVNMPVERLILTSVTELLCYFLGFFVHL